MYAKTMKICKDGRIYGQNNKEAGSHLGVLTGHQPNKEKAKEYYLRNYIKKGYNMNSGASTRFKIGQNTGVEHYNYKGTTSLCKQIRQSFKYRQWRSDIFQRDNYACQLCGTSGGRKNPLNAHHIVEFADILEKNEIITLEEAMVCEELWNINNGITYCEDCHKEEHKEVYFANFNAS